jgi:hypothetical protein
MPTVPTMNSNNELLKTHQQVYETALRDLGSNTDRSAADGANTPIYQRRRAAAGENSSNRALADAAEALSAIWRNSRPLPGRIRARNRK